jgi:hypothetical protein
MVGGWRPELVIAAAQQGFSTPVLGEFYPASRLKNMTFRFVNGRYGIPGNSPVQRTHLRRRTI